MGSEADAPLPDDPLAIDRGFSQTRTDLEQWKAGDREAGDRLLRRYQTGFEILVLRRVNAVKDPAIRRRLSAADSLQNTYMTVLRKVKDFDFRGPGSLLGWMIAIADHEVSDRVDYWKAKQRTPVREESLQSGGGDTAQSYGEPAASEAGPRTRLEVRERDMQIAAAIAELPEREFRIVMLKYYVGATWDDIARDVGSPSGDAARKEHAKCLPALALTLRGLV